MNIVKYKDKCYRPFTSRLFTDYVEAPLPEVVPTTNYTGPKIPLPLWTTVLAWFQAHAKDEVQCRLFLNQQTKQWSVQVYPQEYPSGMTTRELAAHSIRTAINEEMSKAGFMEFGTIHHHCSATAFQSSTDNADEKGRQGVHITVGKLDCAELDIHGRVRLRIPGVLDDQGNCIVPMSEGFFDIDWLDWFELPAEAQALPAHLKAYAMPWYLKQRAPVDATYPIEWDSRLIKREPAVYGSYPKPFDQWKGLEYNPPSHPLNAPTPEAFPDYNPNPDISTMSMAAEDVQELMLMYGLEGDDILDLLCDIPIEGLDPVAKNELLESLAAITDNWFLTSQDLVEVVEYHIMPSGKQVDL